MRASNGQEETAVTVIGRYVRETAKAVIYRTPLLGRLMAPTYPYKLEPAQLAAMVAFIDATRAQGAAIVEIGVAQGATSVFLLEHLKFTGDTRPLLLFDTFRGFTAESIRFEVEQRGKAYGPFYAFRYGDERRLQRNLRRAGYNNFRTFAGDAAAFDWSTLGPIGAVLLDIDVYQPTLAILEQVWPNLAPGGGMVIDDCVEGTPYDGGFQALRDFVAAKGITAEPLGYKGAILRAPLRQATSRLNPALTG
jgi:predicted O-methyltransferase YrrM